MATRDAAASSFMGAFDFDSPARAPVVLSTKRNVPPVVRPDPEPVYLMYTAVVLAVAALMAAAALTTRLGDRARVPGTDGLPEGAA